MDPIGAVHCRYEGQTRGDLDQDVWSPDTQQADTVRSRPSFVLSPRTDSESTWASYRFSYRTN